MLFIRTWDLHCSWGGRYTTTSSCYTELEQESRQNITEAHLTTARRSQVLLEKHGETCTILSQRLRFSRKETSLGVTPGLSRAFVTFCHSPKSGSSQQQLQALQETESCSVFDTRCLAYLKFPNTHNWALVKSEKEPNSSLEWKNSNQLQWISWNLTKKLTVQNMKSKPSGSFKHYYYYYLLI